MVEPRQSAMQRIQVGLIGLVVVLLFVSLANMVLDRVGDLPASGVDAIEGTATTDVEAMPDEPLAELGVTPVAAEEENRQADTPTRTGNTRQAPAPSGP